ncbi:MAG: hypothetical protein AAGA54_09665 [Myxococcota bacterium]
MFVATTLSLVLTALVTTAAGPEDLLSDPDAQAYVADAQIYFAEGDFAQAAVLIEKAYLIEPVPELLFPWAQAEREQGNCEAAVDLYSRFLEERSEGAMADAARTNLERCEEEIGAAVVELEDEDEEPLDEDDLDELTEDDPEPEPEPEPNPEPTKDDEPKAKKWYKDPAGGVLTGLGVVGVGVGAALLGVAGSTANGAPDAASLADYNTQSDQAVTQRNAGAGVLSVGGALLVAGVIRYAVVAKKNKSSKKASAALWGAPGTAGVVFSGRF